MTIDPFVVLDTFVGHVCSGWVGNRDYLIMYSPNRRTEPRFLHP